MNSDSLDKAVSVSNLVRLIRRMEEYKNWKRSVFLRDRFTCQQCGARNGRKRVIEADHIISITQLVRENKVDSLVTVTNCGTLTTGEPCVMRVIRKLNPIRFAL